MTQAKQSLPLAATAEGRDYLLEIDAGHAGSDHSFCKQKAKRSEVSHGLWVVMWAERA